jgi:hypothetical protein
MECLLFPDVLNFFFTDTSTDWQDTLVWNGGMLVGAVAIM